MICYRGFPLLLFVEINLWVCLCFWLVAEWFSLETWHDFFSLIILWWLNLRMTVNKVKINKSLFLWSVVFFIFLTLLLLLLCTHTLSCCSHTLSVFGKIHLENFIVSFKSKYLNGRQDVLPIDGLPFLIFTFFASLTGDERYKLRYTLLNSLLRVLSYFSIVGQGLLHDSADVGDGKEPGVVGGIS